MTSVIVVALLIMPMGSPSLIPQEQSPDETFRISPLLFSEPARTKATASERAELAAGHFQAGSSVLCEFELSGAALDEDQTPHVSSSFVIRRQDGGVAVRSEPVTVLPASNGRLLRRALIDLRGLAEGKYALRMTVCDEVGGTILEVDAPIEVGPSPGGLTRPLLASKAMATLSAAHTLDGYLVLVEEYRRGRREPAVRALAEWTRTELGLAVDQLVLAHPSICDSACRQAAVLLETDLAFFVLRAWDEDEAHRHLAAARALLDSAAPSDGFRRDFLLAVGHNCRERDDLTAALGLFGECIGRLPNDAICHLAAAVTGEELTFRFVSGSDLRTRVAESELDRKQARDAEGHFRRALGLVPDWIEAHLRWARYQVRRGELDEAQREAHWVLAHTSEPRVRSRARLLLGVCEERQQRFGEAIVHYRAAVNEEPSSQAARVALSHALYRNGQRTAAGEEARGLLDWPGGSQLTDGWLSAWTDGAMERDRLMQGLRSEINR